MIFFYIDLDLLLFFRDVCRQPVVPCFVIDLFQLVVVLLTVSFFMVFASTVQMVKFDSIESSDQILLVSILQIRNLKYFMHWIIKRICVLSGSFLLLI